MGNLTDKLKTMTFTMTAGTGQSETFSPQPGDVFICTPSKCGTTMTQQIVQSLRTRGDMAFGEISLVIPYVELHHAFGYEDLDTPQPGCLRAFKTHRWQPWCPGGFRGDCKYIYVIRNPVEVSTSLYHFMDGWLIPEGAVTAEEFVKDVFLAVGEPIRKHDHPSIWHHLLSWYHIRSAPNMLFLFYEDIVQNKAACIEMMAKFLDISLDDTLMEITITQSSKEAMAANLSKYDDHPLKQRANVGAGLSQDAGKNQGKVRQEPKATLSEATVEALQQRWIDLLEPVTGCSTYEAFRAKTNAELGRPF